ncbi:FABP family protein [Brevibacterium album]|uniref:FABP family protein n=1 Tax=Brevibacterium album TaxID=417948 RepID=UPI0003F7A938|nr:FABP family protein [Brevibacterium album]
MPVEIPVDLQPELVPLAWLIGTWEGRGAVVYPDVEEREIAQRIVFERVGEQPYLLYRCETWLLEPASGGAADGSEAGAGDEGTAGDADATGAAVAGDPAGAAEAREAGSREPGSGAPEAADEPVVGPVLGVETGIWQLARERGAHDTGPGLLPPTADSPFATAEAVEELRTERGDFAIEASIAYPHGLMEHYTGRIAGPRVDLVADGGVRTPQAKDYRSSSRMYGLVNGDLLWAWDMAAGRTEAVSHASAQLSRVTPSVLG